MPRSQQTSGSVVCDLTETQGPYPEAWDLKLASRINGSLSSWQLLLCLAFMVVWTTHSCSLLVQLRAEGAAGLLPQLGGNLEAHFLWQAGFLLSLVLFARMLVCVIGGGRPLPSPPAAVDEREFPGPLRHLVGETHRHS